MATNDFPFIPQNLTIDDNIQPDVAISADTLPIFAEWAYDYEKKELKLKDKMPYLVFKNDALEIWIWKALHPETELFAYLAYTPEYGNEFNNLIARFVNSDVRKSELQRIITEALICNPYILSVSDFIFNQTGSVMNIQATVTTVYGKLTTTLTRELMQ